jgi:hypothetical protein
LPRKIGKAKRRMDNQGFPETKSSLSFTMSGITIERTIEKAY